MKQIATIKQPTSGKILYNGKDINTLDDKYREVIGYLPQDFDAYKNFSSKECLM
jgi:ABC-type multidrug transport system ATPase subunit